MHTIIKKLAATATATALIGAIGASVAQTEVDSQTDPMASQQVDVPANASGQQIYFFRDQGNSPETDPAAHLLLIKHRPLVPVAERTTTTTVAQSTTPMDSPTSAPMDSATSAPMDTAAPMAAESDTSSAQSSADTNVAMADESPALPPKADRN